jgi:membrane-associated phospholipid phosphatase
VSNNLPILNSVKNNNSLAILGRLQSELAIKFILLVVLNLLVYVPYLFLQRHHFFPVTNMPMSFFDRLIPFSDKGVWPYLSIYLLMPVGPFLMANRRQIFRYAAGIVIIGFVADTFFLFWPTACPRPDATGTNSIYRALVLVDNPFHAFPSLHAAFAVYSACCAALVLRELQVRWYWRVGVWLWALLILFATLATKQHVVADVAAGSALALGAYHCAFTSWKSRSHAKSPPAVTSNQTLTDSTVL